MNALADSLDPLPVSPEQPLVLANGGPYGETCIDDSHLQAFIQALWAGDWSSAKADEVSASVSTLIRLYMFAHVKLDDPLLQDLMFLYTIARARLDLCVADPGAGHQRPAFLMWQAD